MAEVAEHRKSISAHPLREGETQEEAHYWVCNSRVSPKSHFSNNVAFEDIFLFIYLRKQLIRWSLNTSFLPW